MKQKCKKCGRDDTVSKYFYRKSLEGLICSECELNEVYERKQKNKMKSRRRREQLQYGAELNGFETWSEMMTYIKNEAQAGRKTVRKSINDFPIIDFFVDNENNIIKTK